MFFVETVLENAARAYGLAESELFQSIDLFEKRNIPQVTQCLYTLGRHVSVRFLPITINSSLFFSLGTKEEFQWSNNEC